MQDNHLKTGDGFFARMSPRLDAVEEVTLTTAGKGADANGQGATQIRFTTRSGRNLFRGSLYHFYQTEKLNTNTLLQQGPRPAEGVRCGTSRASASAVRSYIPRPLRRARQGLLLRQLRGAPHAVHDYR